MKIKILFPKYVRRPVICLIDVKPASLPTFLPYLSANFRSKRSFKIRAFQHDEGLRLIMQHAKLPAYFFSRLIADRSAYSCRTLNHAACFQINSAPGLSFLAYLYNILDLQAYLYSNLILQHTYIAT